MPMANLYVKDVNTRLGFRTPKELQKNSKRMPKEHQKNNKRTKKELKNPKELKKSSKSKKIHKITAKELQNNSRRIVGVEWFWLSSTI